MLSVVLFLAVAAMMPPSAAANSVVSYATTNRCGSVPAGHPTSPMSADSAARGVELTFGDYNITVCNTSASAAPVVVYDGGRRRG